MEKEAALGMDHSMGRMLPTPQHDCRQTSHETQMYISLLMPLIGALLYDG